MNDKERIKELEAPLTELGDLLLCPGNWHDLKPVALRGIVAAVKELEARIREINQAGLQLMRDKRRLEEENQRLRDEIQKSKDQHKAFIDRLRKYAGAYVEQSTGDNQ